MSNSKLTFLEAVKRAEYATDFYRGMGIKFCVCIIDGYYMSVQNVVANDHKYQILCSAI